MFAFMAIHCKYLANYLSLLNLVDPLAQGFSNSGAHPVRGVRCNARGGAFDPGKQACIYNIYRQWSF